MLSDDLSTLGTARWLDDKERLPSDNSFRLCEGAKGYVMVVEGRCADDLSLGKPLSGSEPDETKKKHDRKCEEDAYFLRWLDNTQGRFPS